MSDSAMAVDMLFNSLPPSFDCVSGFPRPLLYPRGMTDPRDTPRLGTWPRGFEASINTVHCVFICSVVNHNRGGCSRISFSNIVIQL